MQARRGKRVRRGSTDGVEPQYVRDELLDEFFRNFWVRRVAHNVGSKF